MGYDVRHVLVTSIVIDGVPAPGKRLCIERNRHRPRAQYPLDEEDVVACVAARVSSRRVDGVVAPSTASVACCSRRWHPPRRRQREGPPEGQDRPLNPPEPPRGPPDVASVSSVTPQPIGVDQRIQCFDAVLSTVLRNEHEELLICCAELDLELQRASSG